jgi:hypothetical protein
MMADETKMLKKFEGLCQDSTSKSMSSLFVIENSESNDFWEELAGSLSSVYGDM